MDCRRSAAPKAYATLDNLDKLKRAAKQSQGSMYLRVPARRLLGPYGHIVIFGFDRSKNSYSSGFLQADWLNEFDT